MKSNLYGIILSALALGCLTLEAVKHKPHAKTTRNMTDQPVKKVKTSQVKAQTNALPAQVCEPQVPTGEAVQNIDLQLLAASRDDVDVFLRAQPNCNGAVGPTQYVEFTNHNVRSFNKFTGEPDGILDIDSATFLGTPIADAMMTFDRWGQRWIMTGDIVIIGQGQEAITPSVAIAWSDGPIITEDTIWSLYHFESATLVPQIGEIDSPKLSSDVNAVYIDVDTFNANATAFFGVTSVIIPQSSFVEGNPFNFTVFPGLFSPEAFPFLEGIGFANSPDGYDADQEFGYIIISPNFEIPGFFTYENYYMLRIINPGSANPTLYPANVTQENLPILLPAPVFTDVGLSALPHKGNLYNYPANLQNFTGLDFGMPHIRNKQLYFAQVGLVDATGTGNINGDRTAILWYQYDLTGDPTGQGLGTEMVDTVPALIQAGVIFDPIPCNPLNYWNPAITSDKYGNLALVGNYTGVDSYIQAFYTGRLATDAPCTMRAPVLLTEPNENSYNFGTLEYTDGNSLRWGDYCSIKPDSTNDTDIWATSQIVAFQDGWGILATKLTQASS